MQMKGEGVKFCMKCMVTWNLWKLNVQNIYICLEFVVSTSNDICKYIFILNTDDSQYEVVFD